MCKKSSALCVHYHTGYKNTDLGSHVETGDRVLFGTDIHVVHGDTRQLSPTMEASASASKRSRVDLEDHEEDVSGSKAVVGVGVGGGGAGAGVGGSGDGGVDVDDGKSKVPSLVCMIPAEYGNIDGNAGVHAIHYTVDMASSNVKKLLLAPLANYDYSDEVVADVHAAWDVLAALFASSKWMETVGTCPMTPVFEMFGVLEWGSVELLAEEALPDLHALFKPVQTNLERKDKVEALHALIMAVNEALVDLNATLPDGFGVVSMRPGTKVAAMLLVCYEHV